MSKTVTLADPIQVDGRDLTTLTFRKARLGDYLEAAKVEGALAQTNYLLATMAGLSPADFARVTMDDYTMIVAEVESLLGKQSEPKPTGG